MIVLKKIHTINRILYFPCNSFFKILNIKTSSKNGLKNFVTIDMVL